MHFIKPFANFSWMLAGFLLASTVLRAQAPKPVRVGPEGQQIAAQIADVYGGPQEYIETFLLEAQKLEHEQGIPAPMVVGIAILESGGFSSFLFENARNPFGMRATYPWKGETFVMFHEGADAPFRKYAHAREAVQDFSVLLYSRVWLADALNCPDGDTNCYLQKLSASEKPKHPGYSRDPRWAEKIKGIIKRYGLDKL
ncbi:MAG: glucosaminidase domain-containing protein [Saprospiraceae bacterium]|nr:glucosaminidase domain-containing protein [Saprospiraceae bacterium]